MIVADERPRGRAQTATSSQPVQVPAQPVVFSFDVEEHDRIEAAMGLTIDSSTRQIYRDRMESTTYRLLELLAECDVLASFYIVGEIARSHPNLVKAIAAAGHEIGSHSWSHQRVLRFDRAGFSEDLQKSRDALAEVSGQPVVGFRAPTFSIDHRTPWAIDVLAELGFRYDSSIFPVRHDRYGVSDAPRLPCWVRGESRQLIELPPTTYRLFGQNLPMAGGGYFRLFPLQLMRAGLAQINRQPNGVGMLYFHPWEFDPNQPRLPLKQLSAWRTYVGIKQSLPRLKKLLCDYQSQTCRAIDVVNALQSRELQKYQLGKPTV